MSIYSDKLTQVQVVINCWYFTAPTCMHLWINTRLLFRHAFLDDIMSQIELTTFFFKSWVVQGSRDWINPPHASKLYFDLQTEGTTDTHHKDLLISTLLTIPTTVDLMNLTVDPVNHTEDLANRTVETVILIAATAILTAAGAVHDRTTVAAVEEVILPGSIVLTRRGSSILSAGWVRPNITENGEYRALPCRPFSHSAPRPLESDLQAPDNAPNQHLLVLLVNGPTAMIEPRVSARRLTTKSCQTLRTNSNPPNQVNMLSLSSIFSTASIYTWDTQIPETSKNHIFRCPQFK